MKILVTGGGGQLGRSLQARGAVALSHAELDVGNDAAVRAALELHAPDVVVHAAAFTAVDAAESAPERALALNGEAAGRVAAACAARHIPLLHVSTDYVFAGHGERPIDEEATTAPINAYGRSKADGERRVLDAGGTVVRTSWLFASGGPGFVQTILRLARSERELRVVADQHGRPTWAGDLADGLIALAGKQDRPAIIHLCGAEATTWHGFALAIVAEARRHGPIVCERIVAITSADRPAAARRPAYSVLATGRAEALGLPIRSFRPGLARVIAEET